MTDFCQTASMSFLSPLRFTTLSKSHWHFFFFSTSFYSVIEEPLALLHIRDARSEFILSPNCATLVRCY